MSVRAEAITHHLPMGQDARDNAVRYVCGHAADVADARLLLDVLGLLGDARRLREGAA